MGAPDQEKLLQLVDELLDTMLTGGEKLLQLLRQAAIAGDQHAVSVTLVEQLQRRAFKVTRLHQNRPLYYAELSSGSVPALLLYNRYTKIAPDIWELIPIVITFLVVDLYCEAHGDIPLPVTIKWLLDGGGQEGESDGEPVLDEILREQQHLFPSQACLWDETRQMIDAGLMGDGAPLLLLGAKGLLRVELSVRTAPAALPTLHSTIVTNAAWRLLWALNSIKDVREDILIEGFYDALKVPEDEVVAALYALPDSSQRLLQRLGVDHLLYDLQGFQLHYTQLLTPTCTINALNCEEEGVNRDSSMPAYCAATVDFQLVPEQKPEDILIKLTQHLRLLKFDDVHVRVLSMRDPVSLSLAHSLVQTALMAATRAYGHPPVILPLLPVSSPLYILRRLLHMPVIVNALHPSRLEVTALADDPVRTTIVGALKQYLLIIAGLSKRGAMAD